MNLKLSALLFLSSIASMTSTYALDVLEYKFTNSYRYSLLEDANLEQFEGKYILTTSFAHISSPFYIQDNKTGAVFKKVVNSYDLISLGASYLVNDNFQVMLETAIVKVSVLTEKEIAVGDTHIKGKYLIWKNAKQALALSPELIFASGSEMAFTTRTALGFALRATYEYHFDKLHFVGSLGFDYGKENVFSNIDNTKMILGELGVSYDIMKDWNLNFEMLRWINSTSGTGQSSQEGDFYLTAKYNASKDYSLYGGVGAAGLAEPDKMNKTIFLGLKYSFGSSKTERAFEPAPYVEEQPAIEEAPIESSQYLDPGPPVVIAPLRSQADEVAKYGTKFTGENLYFENGRTAVDFFNSNKVEDLAREILKNPENIKKIVIEGYASKAGNSAQNQVLSDKRANNAKDALVKQGISSSLMETVGYGDKKSKKKSSPEEERKVQFRIYFHEN